MITLPKSTAAQALGGMLAAQHFENRVHALALVSCLILTK